MQNTKPTIRELLEEARRREGFVVHSPLATLAERVEAVLRLHVEWADCVCKHDYAVWPCPTIRALEGEESR